MRLNQTYRTIHWGSFRIHSARACVVTAPKSTLVICHLPIDSGDNPDVVQIA